MYGFCVCFFVCFDVDFVFFVVGFGLVGCWECSFWWFSVGFFVCLCFIVVVMLVFSCLLFLWCFVWFLFCCVLLVLWGVGNVFSNLVFVRLCVCRGN